MRGGGAIPSFGTTTPKRLQIKRLGIDVDKKSTVAIVFRMKTTATVKKIFVIRDHGGDLGKKWFVHFKDPETGRWLKHYEGINTETTLEGREGAAKALLDKLLKAYKPPPANATTRGELYAALELKRATLRKKSFQSYAGKLNSLFEFLQGDAVDVDGLSRYFQHCERTLAPGTVYDTFFTIKQLLTDIGLGHLVGTYKPPKPQPEPFRYFQKHEQKRLIEYLSEHDPELLLWCSFVYYCFLRPRSELRFLQIHHIHFDDAKILVPANVSKNKKSQYVVIPDAFLPALAVLQSRNPRSYIFPGKKQGKPTGYNTMGRRFHIVLDFLGFDTKLYNVYSWKHSGAVDCVKAGISIKELQLQLRHHSLDQVDQYLRQLGLIDLMGLKTNFPKIGNQ